MVDFLVLSVQSLDHARIVLPAPDALPMLEDVIISFTGLVLSSLQ